MDSLALVVALISLALNVLFLVLLKFTNIMRGPTGYTGAMGMSGRDCICPNCKITR